MPETPTVNPTPKQRFQLSSKAISDHRNMVQSPTFQMALDFALLQYGADLTLQRSDANLAAASHFRLMGAHEFIHTLRNLAEMPPRLPQEKEPNLIHKA